MLLFVLLAATATSTASPAVEVGLGDGVTLRSADGQSRLNLRARVQVRLTESFPTEGLSEGVDELQVRRARLALRGALFDGLLELYVQLGFSNRDMESDLRLPLRDAVLTYRPLRDLGLKVGQMKVPFGRQRVTSSGALQLVDRALVVQELNLDRDVGVQVFSTDLFGLGRRIAYNLGLFSGDGRNRLSGARGLLLVGRLQVAPFGGFDDLPEADLDRDDRVRLALGASVAFNDDTNRPRSTFDTPYRRARFDYFHAGGDLVLKWRGLSVLGELLYRRADRAEDVEVVDGAEVRERSRSAWGAFVQVGLLPIEHLELVLRYGELVPLDEAVERSRELGGGLGWYFHEHDLKVQVDYFWLSGEAIDDGRHQVRAQVQLAF